VAISLREKKFGNARITVPPSFFFFFAKRIAEELVTMKSKILLALVLCFLFVSCDLFNPKKFADVILVDGPRFEAEDPSFSYTGTVRNIGEGKALYVRVYIEVNNPGDILLAQGNSLVDKTDLDPGEASTFRVTFEDEDYELRDLMDNSKTTYAITWSDED
jgi:hypothetical protein